MTKYKNFGHDDSRGFIRAELIIASPGEEELKLAHIIQLSDRVNISAGFNDVILDIAWKMFEEGFDGAMKKYAKVHKLDT